MKFRKGEKGDGHLGHAAYLVPDVELCAISDILRTLNTLSQQGVGRVIRYACDRFGALSPNGGSDTAGLSEAGAAYWRARLLKPEETKP